MGKGGKEWEGGYLLLQADDARPFLLEKAFIFLAGGIVKGIAYGELLAQGGGAGCELGGGEVGNYGFVATLQVSKGVLSA